MKRSKFIVDASGFPSRLGCNLAPRYDRSSDSEKTQVGEAPQMTRVRVLVVTGLLWMCGSVAAGEEGLFPFVVAYDTPANATNVSAWLDRPAGVHGFIRVEGGHLKNDAGPVRFWATNICFEACFPTHQQAERLARLDPPENPILQSCGSWGTPIPLWSGGTTYQGPPGVTFVGIMGVSPQGQVLGFGGVNNLAWWSYNPTLYLYDTKTQALTNLTSLVSSMTWPNSTQLPMGESPNWSLHLPYVSQLDNQGRILVQADESQTLGGISVTHTLLLIPEGVPADPIPVPEPESWAVFATLIGGWIAHNRLRSRTRS